MNSGQAITQQVVEVLEAVGKDPADYDVEGIVAELDGEHIDVTTVVSRFWRIMLSKRRTHTTARARRAEPDR